MKELIEAHFDESKTVIDNKIRELGIESQEEDLVARLGELADNLEKLPLLNTVANMRISDLEAQLKQLETLDETSIESELEKYTERIGDYIISTLEGDL